MSIVARCQCGKSFKVKDEYAGKKGKCPDCGQVVVIPKATRPTAPGAAAAASAKPKPAAPKRRPADTGGFDLDDLSELEHTGTVLPDEPVDAPAASPPTRAPAAPARQKACPACGKIISSFARVCEHCGAAVVPGATAAGVAPPRKGQAVSSGDAMTVVDWLMVIFCPLIAIWVARAKGKDGMRTAAYISFAINVVIGLIGRFASMAAKGD